MEFIVEFSVRKEDLDKKQEGERSYLVTEIGKPGLDLLDDVRETFPRLANTPANNIYIDTECPVTSDSLCVTVTEKEARKAGNIFRGNTKVKVRVPEGSLTSYIYMQEAFYTRERQLDSGLRIIGMLWIRKPKIEKFLYTDIMFKLNTDTLIKDWAAAGYPLEWDIGRHYDTKAD